MKKITARNLIILTVLILVVLGVGWFFVGTDDSDARERLAELREEAREHRGYALRSAVPDEHRDDFSRCTEMTLYDAYAQRQPHELSSGELEEALELANRCGSVYPDRRRFSTEQTAQTVEEIREVLSELSSVSDEQTERYLGLWEELIDALFDQSERFTRLSEIQRLFWETEREFRSEDIALEERNGRVSELNREATEHSRVLRELGERIGGLSTEEEELWQDLL